MLNLPPTELLQLSEKSVDTSKVQKTRKPPQVSWTKYIFEVVSNTINPKSWNSWEIQNL